MCINSWKKEKNIAYGWHVTVCTKYIRLAEWNDKNADLRTLSHCFGTSYVPSYYMKVLFLHFQFEQTSERKPNEVLCVQQQQQKKLEIETDP